MLSPETDDYEQQLFIIVDNEVLLQVRSYKQSLSALLGVHYMVNLEYPRKPTCLHWVSWEYVFSIRQKKNALYRKGVSTLLA